MTELAEELSIDHENQPASQSECPRCECGFTLAARETSTTQGDLSTVLFVPSADATVTGTVAIPLSSQYDTRPPAFSVYCPAAQ